MIAPGAAAPSAAAGDPYPPELARFTVPGPPGEAIPYGADPEQFGELWPGGGARCVVLLHGGYWRKRYRLDLMHALADDLCRDGYTVWNLEYRRAGCQGGGWPGTFADVAAGFDALARLGPAHRIDPEQVTVIGHSAGGHLALWLAAGRRAHGSRPAPGSQRASGLRPAFVIGLAPVCDLVLAYQLGLSEHAAAELLGGTPASDPERYRGASPAALLPLRCRQVIVHGTADNAVPFDLSVRYAAAARRAGDDCRLIRLPGVGHMELIDPRTPAWRTVKNLLRPADPSAG